MRTTLNIFFSLLLLVVMPGCAKDELDVAELNTNPFDPDYAGPAIFTYIGATTTTTIVNGQPRLTLNIRVQVHTEYFARITTYYVEQVDGGLTPSSSIPNDVLTIQIPNVDPGETYCRRLYLYNDGVRGGGGDEICGTAE